MLRFGSNRRLFALVVAAVMLGGLAPLSQPGAANAVVLPAPSLTSPADGSTASANPVFAWAAVPNATKYRIEISANASFSPTVLTDETANLRYAPATELPLGTLYWRVAARDSGNTLGNYAARDFIKAWGASPTPTSPPLTDPSDPDDVVSLEFPTDPLLFTWNGLPGAQSYQLQVDDADDFIGATTYATKNTAYVITEPRTVGQTFFWRLRGVSGGNFSVWSAIGKFRSTWTTKPVLMYPADNATDITDVYFDWDPVLGAKTYQLQVSPNGDWTNNKTIDVTVKSTRYAPPEPLNNGNYFWRVRALDAASLSANFGPWSDNEGVTGDEQRVPAWLGLQAGTRLAEQRRQHRRREWRGRYLAEPHVQLDARHAMLRGIGSGSARARSMSSPAPRLHHQSHYLDPLYQRRWHGAGDPRWMLSQSDPRDDVLLGRGRLGQPSREPVCI